MSTHTFQPPKGTRDFYPAEMAVRRYIESVWRTVSINHGFEEIEGPNFEHLDLYTVKSGEAIVSELFSFRRAGGDMDYALRPEFTPTLARMVAARASSLPMPIKWFCIPNHFRAERPQRGRLREFIQWNVDMIGDSSPRADAEIIAVAVGVLRGLGLSGADVTVHINHRELVADALTTAGVARENIEQGMILLDRKSKLDSNEFTKQYIEMGFDHDAYCAIIEHARTTVNDAMARIEQDGTIDPETESDDEPMRLIVQLLIELDRRNVLKWCTFNPNVVRGLAYYTGIVFEVLAEGERAIAGGGRYDTLVEMFGGPSLPAVGFAMGDVVLRLVLENKGLLQAGETYLPRPDIFILSNGSDAAERELPRLVTRLRAKGYHVRHSYKTTRNIGKLLSDANKQRARCAIILGDELERHHVVVKDLGGKPESGGGESGGGGGQREVSLDDLDEALAHILE